MNCERVWNEGPVFCSAAAAPAAGTLGSASAAGWPVRSSNQIIGGRMGTQSNGFIKLPSGRGVIYLRAASIDAVWASNNITYIQMRGGTNPDELRNSSLPPIEVLSLIAAAQDG